MYGLHILMIQYVHMYAQAMVLRGYINIWGWNYLISNFES
jgi:hypothetical protein